MVFSYLIETISSVAKLGDKFSCGLCLFLQLMSHHLDSKDMIRLELSQIKKNPTIILNEVEGTLDKDDEVETSWSGGSWVVVHLKSWLWVWVLCMRLFFHVSVEIYCIVLFCGVKLNICQSRLLTNNGQVWESVDERVGEVVVESVKYFHLDEGRTNTLAFARTSHLHVTLSYWYFIPTKWKRHAISVSDNKFLAFWNPAKYIPFIRTNIQMQVLLYF